MPESASTIYRRRLRMVDNAIYNAIADLFPYYCLLMRADPVLAASCERLMLEWETSRETLHKVYILAWEQDHPQFSTIGSAAELIQSERHRTRTGGYGCPDYSQLWGAMVAESYKLLEKRAAALQQPSVLPPSKL